MLITLALVVLSQSASDYPKVIRKDGQVCVQTLVNGKVEESCRAEGSDVRTNVPSASRNPLPATGATPFDSRPVPFLGQPRQPPTASALYWADAKKNWALAFKIGTVAALTSSLVSLVAGLVAGGSGVPRAAEPYLAGSAIAGTGALLFTIISVLFDRWGFQEIEPDTDPLVGSPQ